MLKKKKFKKISSDNVEVWTENKYEEYMQDLYGMEFIAGFTESGVPYGTFKDEYEDKHNDKIDIKDINSNIQDNDDLPF
jgi:hypothetical protein